MPFSVQCPACKSKFKATDDLAGTQQNCPICQKPFQIPVPANPPTEKPTVPKNTQKNAASQNKTPALKPAPAQPKAASSERPVIVTDASKPTPAAAPSMPIIVTDSKSSASASDPSVKPILTTDSAPSPQAPSPQDSSAPQAETSRSSSNPFQTASSDLQSSILKSSAITTFDCGLPTGPIGWFKTGFFFGLGLIAASFLCYIVSMTLLMLGLAAASSLAVG